MRIGLVDVDGRNFPNLALMKLSAWHKAQGDAVEWWNGFTHYNRVYLGRLSPVEFRRRYLDSPGASHPLVVHIGAHGMDDRGCYKSLQVSPWEFHLLVRHAKERAGRRNARVEHNSSND